MATWQWVLTLFVVLVPVTLMLDFWPDRERLDAGGRPLEREWRPSVREPEPADEHHET